MNDREQLLQWQIQGRGRGFQGGGGGGGGGAGGSTPPPPPPPYLTVWMTAHPPLLISRSGSGTVLVSTLGRRLSDKDVH